jgi:hypothetical protein
MNAIQIETFSNSVTVIKAVNVPDVGALPGEVVIALAEPANSPSNVLFTPKLIRPHGDLTRSHEGGIHGQA